MGVLKRKNEGTEVISVRLPTAIKAKLVKLRQRAHVLGVQLQCHVRRSPGPGRKANT